MLEMLEALSTLWKLEMLDVLEVLEVVVEKVLEENVVVEAKLVVVLKLEDFGLVSYSSFLSYC